MGSATPVSCLAWRFLVIQSLGFLLSSGGHEPTASVSAGLMNRSPSKDGSYRHTACRELLYIEMLEDLGLSILDFFAFSDVSLSVADVPSED